MIFVVAAVPLILLAVIFFMGISAGAKPRASPAWHEFSATNSVTGVIHSDPSATAAVIPLIVCGRRSTDSARTLAIASGFDCIAVDDLKTLQLLLRERWVMGIIACSDPSGMMDAGKAIRLFRKYYPDAGVALYMAEDRYPDLAAQQALDCQADAILPADLDEAAMVTYLNAVIGRIERDEPRPATVVEHRDLLQALLSENTAHDPMMAVATPG